MTEYMINYKFHPEEKKQMLSEISYFMQQEHGLEMGIIGTENMFEFFVEMFGDRLFNMGLDEAKLFYEKYRGNMESDFYSLYKDMRQIN